MKQIRLRNKKTGLFYEIDKGFVSKTGTVMPEYGAAHNVIMFSYRMSREQEDIEIVPADRRGGARKGAGRKPLTVKKVGLTVNLEPDELKKFKSICKARGNSQAKQISEWIRRARL